LLVRRSAYPFAADILFVLPSLIDTIGNALDLYDTIDWWDDANHFVNWALLSGALAATAYTDTLGDMALGLSGSTLTATIAVVVLRGR
jgi:hypothetical protein